MVDVFISYARAEREMVEPIREKLAALDLDLFFDLDGIDGGDNFPDVITRALRASSAVLCCWTPRYFTRPWCLIECRHAFSRDKLTPVRLTPFDQDAPPADLELVSYYDLAGWSGEDAHEDWNRTLVSLGGKLGRELAPKLSKSWFGGVTAGPTPQAPADAAQKADLLEDWRKTWAGFAGRDDIAAVERFMARLPQAAAGSGLEFEIETHLRGLKFAAAKPASPIIAGVAGTVFRDTLKSGGEGPAMCVIPAGKFWMGSPEDEPGRSDAEGPRHQVSFAAPFAMGRDAVTFEEYDAFCAATGAERPGYKGWGRANRPVINVSWHDAQAFCEWLSEEAGAAYRLPSEAEWEYACRAETNTPFWWGREITPAQANYNGDCVYEGGGAEGVYREQTLPVDAFPANPWGLRQTHGNVWEWVQDPWNGSYEGAPQDGSAWRSGDLYRADLRGGSWYDSPRYLRSAGRGRYARDIRGSNIGFRVARTHVE